MIDHLLGRPSASWKRFQVFLVMLFWIWRLVQGSPDGPRVFWLRRFNRSLKRFSPWQIIVGTLTTLYAVRHFDSIMGLGAPEPLARMYSRAYYRATWIITGLDAGILTAMPIRPKWLRDFCSILFSGYYMIYATEADEKVRKFRAMCTVEMLRVTWEKSSNPWIRALTLLERPSIPVVRQILIPRPTGSPHAKPITLWLYFARPERELIWASDLILDFPGGGFISMSPLHHEERLRRWAVRTGKPVLALDYGKAPEYPYPWAIEEGFDTYRMIVESKGRAVGMCGKSLNIIISGDSAGANIAATVIYKILEYHSPLPLPVALVFNYAALDFNFTSWMSPQNLRVLRSEQSSTNIPGLAEQKDHLGHRSPLSVVKDVRDRKPKRKNSWGDSLRLSTNFSFSGSSSPQTSPVRRKTMPPFFRSKSDETSVDGKLKDEEQPQEAEEEYYPLAEQDKPLSARVRFSVADLAKQQAELSEAKAHAQDEVAKRRAPIGTRLTMTSRSGHFQDRIISPSMMRAMAILYIGPINNPDFETDYYISPILGPSAHLAKFPPMLMTCGEKDPFVDDTVIFAGRVREAKRARKAEALAKVGDKLRMSSTAETDPILQEDEEDWVQMRIIEGWGHGYLQMSSALKEARVTIDEIGDWMNYAFASYETRTATASGSSTRISKAPSRRGNGRQPIPSSTETSEADEGLSFQTKKRRTPPNSFSANGDAKPPKRQGPFVDAFDQEGSSSSGEETLPPTPPAGRANSPRKLNVPPTAKPSTPTASPPISEKPNSILSPNISTIYSTMPKVDLSKFGSPVALTPVSAAGRVGTPVKTMLLDENELMRRRRQDAVYGMGESVTPEEDGSRNHAKVTPSSPEVDRDTYGL